jgi:hypothetical protein
MYDIDGLIASIVELITQLELEKIPPEKIAEVVFLTMFTQPTFELRNDWVENYNLVYSETRNSQVSAGLATFCLTAALVDICNEFIEPVMLYQMSVFAKLFTDRILTQIESEAHESIQIFVARDESNNFTLKVQLLTSVNRPTINTTLPTNIKSQCNH